jgi:hypothetical protein
MTVSAERGCDPRMPPLRAGSEDACWVAAKAGNVVAAAEAAPRIRINDLRETPCVRIEFINVLLEGWVVEMHCCRYRWNTN